MSLPEFKLIVAGGRDFNDYRLLSESLDNIANVDYMPYAVSIVSGMAQGADSLAVLFAKRNHVELYKFPADWNQYGKRAGAIRNEEMGNFADGLLAFWDGRSRGTKHMIEFMQKLNKPVTVINY